MKIKLLQNIVDIIRGKQAVKEILSETIFDPKTLKKWRWRFRFYKRLYCKEWQIIYPPQGMGDILYICLLLKEYKKLYRKKILLIVIKPYFKQLAEIFTKEVDEVLLASGENFSFISRLKHHKNVLNIEAELYEKGMKWESFRINLIKIMKLNENAKLEMLTCPTFKLKDTSVSFVKGKSVIISPHATTCPKCVPDSFWTDLANTFLSRGFGVVFNSNDKAFESYQCHLLSIDETIALADECGYFIGYRSGLCDVLAYFSKCKKIFICPSNPHGNTNAEQWFLDATTKELWIHNEAKEYIYSQDLFDVILKEISENS